MEREVGGGIGMGSTCRPMAVSFQCMTKFTTKKKKVSLEDCSMWPLPHCFDSCVQMSLGLEARVPTAEEMPISTSQ